MEPVQNPAKAGGSATPALNGQNPAQLAKIAPKAPENGQKGAETVQTVEAVEVVKRDINAVLERLDKANQAAKVRNAFKEKLTRYENFRRGLDGSQLRCIVQDQNDEEIEFFGNEAIEKFIDDRLVQGREKLRQMDAELAAFIA